VRVSALIRQGPPWKRSALNRSISAAPASPAQSKMGRTQQILTQRLAIPIPCLTRSPESVHHTMPPCIFQQSPGRGLRQGLAALSGYFLILWGCPPVINLPGDYSLFSLCRAGGREGGLRWVVVGKGFQFSVKGKTKVKGPLPRDKKQKTVNRSSLPAPPCAPGEPGILLSPMGLWP